MEIRPAINKPGMFCLVWNDNGIEGGEYFDRIETISTTRDEDATLWNGNVPGTTLHISPEAISNFYDQVNGLGIEVHVTLPSKVKDGNPMEDAA